MKKLLGLDSWQVLAPSLVTFFGLVFSGIWLAGASWIVGLVGLSCDVLDGWVARKTDCVTEFGSLFDWVTDVVVLAVLFGRLGLWPAALVCVPMQVVLRYSRIRFSGRAAVMLVVLGLQGLGMIEAWK